MIRLRQIVGWAAVALSAAFGSLWAFWGAIENFHEGWFYRSLPMNLALMLAQYLLPMIVFVGLSVVAIRWPLVGAGLLAAAAVAAALRFRTGSSNAGLVLIAGPLILLAAAYGYGRPEPKKHAVLLLAGLPLATALVTGIEPAIRVARRFDDGDLGVRRVTGNGVDLVWAPEGPGWPRMGVDWQEAARRCRYLSRDGTALEESPQDIWRLPTAQEAVASMSRHGKNCGGSWNAILEKASYARTPDKESPLWDVHSQVIYWWTGTETGAGKAYVIVYNGRVWPRPERSRWGYLAFRAVKQPAATLRAAQPAQIPSP